MDKALISIIVPVYNAAPYIHRCLNSIISQTYNDWECILVDDGSKDGSGAICDEYVLKDKRFRVFHKINEGVSRARQTGLNHAIGEFVIHADPDDWVELDWLECLYKKIIDSNADMVICDFERIYKNKTVYYCQQPTSLANNDILKDFLNGKLWGCSWNKLIRRKCFVDYHISFHPEMNLWEDLYVMCLLVSKGIKVEYIPKSLYHYDSIINENGIVMHRKNEHISSVMIFINNLSPLLSAPQFEDGWFRVKSKIKEWIFKVNDCKYNIIETCSEINERYINEAKKCQSGSLAACVALCLKGHPFLGRFIYKIVNIHKKIIHKCHQLYQS
jgi:glycosyltransferase involved in cell wall biosynthesis